MDSGHTTSASPFTFAPSTKLLAWALVTGAVLVIGAIRDGQPPQPSAAQAFAAPSASPTPSRTAPSARPAVRTLPAATPVGIQIPAINVNAPVAKLGLDSTGALRPPPGDDPNLAGWYGEGTTPGSAGTALIAGHVDLRGGRRGVFFHLGALAKGATIRISRSDGRTAVFTVDAVEVYSKANFPSNKVYADSGRPELRVITCGGGYAKNTGYLGNVVVYASLAAVE